MAIFLITFQMLARSVPAMTCYLQLTNPWSEEVDAVIGLNLSRVLSKSIVSSFITFVLVAYETLVSPSSFT